MKPSSIPVLLFVVFAAVAATGASAAQTPKAAPPAKLIACPASAGATAMALPSPNDYTSIRRRIETSPLFRAAVAHAGVATQCNISGGQGSFSIEYRFSNGAVLTNDHTLGIEYAKTSLKLTGLSEPEAMSLLKEAAFDHFGTDPKIQWASDKAQRSGTADAREVAYLGDFCNMQARLRYRGNAIIELIISNAC